MLVGPIPGTEFTEKYLYVCKRGRQYLLSRSVTIDKENKAGRIKAVHKFQVRSCQFGAVRDARVNASVCNVY